jgi:hypothetical protein
MTMRPADRSRRRRREEIEETRARADLAFYCWRRTAFLSVVTALAIDVVVAVIEGRPTHTLDEFVLLVHRI